MADKLLHVFGQGAWHDTVDIVGNREALGALRATIALAVCGVGHSMEAFVNDGEGYKVKVCLLEGDWDTPEWKKLALPYGEDYAEEQREDGLGPWQIGGKV